MAFSSRGATPARMMPEPETQDDDRDLAQLVSLAAGEDSDAFADLLAPYRTPLFAFLFRSCGRRDVAEDLMQETLLRCWQGLPGYDHRGRFGAWLFTIARNVVRDGQRRRISEGHATGRETGPVGPPPTAVADPHAEMEGRETAARIQTAIDALPATQREVFLLRQHGGMSFKEIARLLDQPLGSVLSAMHRAVGKIMKEVGHARR